MQRKGLSHIERKVDILSFTLGQNYVEEYIKGKENKLFKGKVHCSCYMCSAKTAVHGYKPRDKRELERTSQDLRSFKYNI